MRAMTATEVAILLRFIPLCFSALLPVINPIGSAMLFLAIVRNADHATMKRLARQIAITTIWFLVIVELSGSFILRFFGLSLPVVQVAGGLVLAAMGWSLLSSPEPAAATDGPAASSVASLDEKIFYPLTFPITAGPGCIVVALTLSAHATEPSLTTSAVAHLGLILGTILIGVVVYLSYAYADRTTAKLSPSVSQGLLRVISFILLCIGGEIMWTGVQSLIKTVK